MSTFTLLSIVSITILTIVNNMETKIEQAKVDQYAMNRLLFDYMPFIKKQVSTIHLTLDFDDMLSIAMLTFSCCVEQYDISKGNFIAFATTSIKNRLIDEARKEGRYIEKVTSLFKDDGSITSSVEAVSIQQYSKELEREALSYEIDVLSIELLNFNIAFRDLPQICPKQKRSRILCLEIAKLLLSNSNMKHKLFVHKKLPQSDLATQLGISIKTVEKHRKYIVTLAVLMSGNYPNIKTFLPQYKEVR